MFSPILSEMVAHERHEDQLRQSERQRLAKSAVVRRPARRLDLPASVGSILHLVRQRFGALAHADQV